MKEGHTTFFAPEKKNIPTKSDLVFYNPNAEISRDISVIFLKSLAQQLNQDLSVCELLAGTGARSLRYIKETPLKKILINDKNPNAIKLIKKNLIFNDVYNSAQITQKDAFKLINEMIGNEWFNFVDIDPFGSPQRYFLAGLLVEKGGTIALTATDIPTLIGIYPKTAFFRYGLTHVFRSEFEKETAIRALLASFQIRMLHFGKEFTPVLSLFIDHYVRVFLNRLGSRKDIYENLGYIGYCKICDKRWILPLKSDIQEIFNEHPHSMQFGGPLWLGPLHCPKKVENLNKLNINDDKHKKRLNHLLARLTGETKQFPPWFFDHHKQAKRRKISPAPINEVIFKIREMDFLAERTHISNTGIKTNTNFGIYCD